MITTLIVAAAALQAQAVHLDFEPARTKVEYSVWSTLHTVHGTFQLKRGAIDYDVTTGKASGEIVIDAASGKSGSDGRDGKMSKTILEAEKYPEIKFMPNRVEGTIQQEQVKLHGQFLLHGATHEMTMTAKVHKEGGVLKTDSTFQIPYIQWGLKNPSTFILKVKDTVDIHIEAEARLKEK